MIVRKPYAFLIKYFRVIHLFILIFSSYLLYKSNRIFAFFSDYAKTRRVFAVESLANSYVPILTFIFCILIILFVVIIFILLLKKDKPKVLYVLMIIYYIAFIVFLFVSKNNINTIQFEGLDPQSSKIIRDVSFAFFIIQIVFTALILIRTLGFDIKKFHFGEDIQALEIELEDNEEVELTSGIDTDKLLRNYEMKKEDLKAFFLEYKVIILFILFLGVVVIPGTFIIRNIVENKKYAENEVINLDDFEFLINGSYISKYSYSGTKLLEGDNSYVIVRFNIKNFSNNERGINIDNLRLEIEDNVYPVNTTNYSYFTDIGTGYNSQKIKKGESKDYIAIFVVPDKQLSKEVIIRYTDRLKYNKEGFDADYKRILLSLNNLDIKDDKDAVLLNSVLDFSDSLLKNTTLNITSYGIKDRYTYKYEDTDKYIVNQEGLVLNMSYKLDLGTDHISNFSDLLTKYAKIIYIIDNKEYISSIKDITPSTYEGDDIYLAVSSDMQTSSTIKIALNIRNTNYEYILK